MRVSWRERERELKVNRVPRARAHTHTHTHTLVLRLQRLEAFGLSRAVSSREGPDLICSNPQLSNLM